VSYEGSVYTLELQTRDGQRYQGFVTLAGRRYPIQGARQGGQLVGRFNDPDGSVYGYVGRPDGANLVFVLDDGETIPFQRVARAPTPARQALPPGRSAAPPPPGSAAPAPPANWPPPPPPPR
jgi:hypothetical protein